MGDEIRITVIATGFDNSGMPLSTPSELRARHLDSTTAVRQQQIDHTSENSLKQPVTATFPPQVVNTGDLDVPAFLRKRAEQNR